MFETVLVTFREGLEAFLIVAITAGYLIKTDKRSLLPALWAGLIFSAVIGAILGDIMKQYSQIKVFEGVSAIVAAVLVASLTYYVAKNAKHFKSQVQSKIDKAHEKQGWWKHLAMFIFTVVMITREAVEVVILLSVISFKYQVSAEPMYIGAAIGTISAGFIGFLWMKYSHLINLAKFMRVTAVFLLLFTLHLFIYGVHELIEANLFTLNHELTEFFEETAEEGFLVWAVTYGMILIPSWFLIQGFINSRKLKA